jgi:WD40 repeat protein
MYVCIYLFVCVCVCSAHAQYTPNGQYLLTSTLDSTLRLIRPLHTCIYTGGDKSSSECVSEYVSAQNSTLNVHKRIKRSCPVRAITAVKTFTGHVTRKYSCPSIFMSTHTHSHMSERVSSTLLFSGSEDNSVCVWDMQSQQLVGSMQGHTGPVLALDQCEGVSECGSDGDGVSECVNVVASGAGGSDCSVRLWSSLPHVHTSDDTSDDVNQESINDSSEHK